MIIHVEDKDGTQKDLEVTANPNTSLMEVLVENQFQVAAICGGMAGCGTCHVTFNKGFDKLEKMEDDEEFMLESLPNLTPHSRLSCQIPITDALNEADVKVLSDG